MRRIATAVAALALIAGAAHAQGNGKGNGQGGGDDSRRAGPSMQGGNGNPGRGTDGGNKDRGEARGPEAGGGAPRAERGNPPGDRGNKAARAVSDARGPGGDKRGPADRGRGGNDGPGRDSRLVVLDERGRDRSERDVVRVASFGAIPARGVIAGCPPGLAKKNPPCVPPGQVRSPLRNFDRPGFWGLRLDDGRYRYDDGYLVRLAPDGRIGGYIPLLGGALAIGNVWPSYYQPVVLPSYYESYYGLGPHESYRYADNVIYQVDPETAAITSIAALLTGDDFAVGQPMPVGYDVYNVPYAYREQYYDRPDALYRYSDGYVYQVDPETRLIAAAIELLAS
jgi:hypothetical protein